ncbi:helix-turn-helix domain-containing protein [Peristeroidobacter agariperforans]
MLQNDRPVCEIAAALGFCDQSYLTRTFRRMTGVTPRDFARSKASVD